MDSTLIFSIKKGDEAIFAEVYHAYHRKLYFFFLKRVKTASLCEELVQEAFIKLWNYRQSLNETLPVSLQLFRIARTTLIDLLRKEARQRMVIVPLEDAGAVPVDNSQQLLLQEKVNYIRNSIRHLPPMRKLIVEYRMDGLSNQEIADHLSISKKTVENHINKAFSEIKNNADLPVFLCCLLVHITY